MYGWPTIIPVLAIVCGWSSSGTNWPVTFIAYFLVYSSASCAQRITINRNCWIWVMRVMGNMVYPWIWSLGGSSRIRFNSSLATIFLTYLQTSHTSPTLCYDTKTTAKTGQWIISGCVYRISAKWFYGSNALEEAPRPYLGTTTVLVLVFGLSPPSWDETLRSTLPELALSQ